MSEPDASNPHDEIERLEAQIDDISSRLESCRKFILAARIAVTGGAVFLTAILIGVVAFDARLLLAAIAALLGGLVVWGSNRSTAEEAAAELAEAEARRSALIESLDLRAVSDAPPPQPRVLGH